MVASNFYCSECRFKPNTTGGSAAPAPNSANVNERHNIINTNGMFNAIFPFQRNSPGIFPNNEFNSVALSSGKQ